MPYVGIEDLPLPVRSHLPEHAQQIFRAAFNNAYKFHAGEMRLDRRQAALPKDRRKMDCPFMIRALDVASDP